MQLLRQFALAALLVAGTTVAVVAYLDVQEAGRTARNGSGAPILEIGPSYPMTRPLRLPSAAEARAERAPHARPTPAEDPAQWVRAPRRREAPAAAPAPATFSREVEVEIRPASSLPTPALR